MVLTHTENNPTLGKEPIDFKLLDTKSGKILSLSNFNKTRLLVISFICNHCPYVKHINQALIRLANAFIPRGVEFVAISANDADNYPEDNPENMKKQAKLYPFPYLYDETQNIAKAYKAACTPEFFIFYAANENVNKQLVYHGGFDNSSPGLTEPQPSGIYLSRALNDCLNSSPNLIKQYPAIGCSIKWKK